MRSRKEASRKLIVRLLEVGLISAILDGARATSVKHIPVIKQWEGMPKCASLSSSNANPPRPCVCSKSDTSSDRHDKDQTVLESGTKSMIGAAHLAVASLVIAWSGTDRNGRGR